MNIIIHKPADEAGLEKLRRIAAEYHAEAVIESIKEMDIPGEQKQKLLETVIEKLRGQDNS